MKKEIEKVKFYDKYLYMYDDFNEQTHYFQHFAGKGERHSVFQVHACDSDGIKFFKKYHGKTITTKLYWFGRADSKLRKLLFIKGKRGEIDYIIIL